MASYKLNVQFNGVQLNHNPYPKYLGVTLDRSLSYGNHLKNTAGKLQTRNNIIQKLTGTTWGASAISLRTAAIALVYSTAEYCSPVWMNSAHVSKIDTQLNTTMRLITGTILSTKTNWLPVLSNIAPPNLRRCNALLKEFKNISDNNAPPIQADIPILEQPSRLISRKPTLKTALELTTSTFDINRAWISQWTDSNTTGLVCIQNPTIPLSGFNLPRHLWSRLNRVRVNCGVCADILYKWSWLPSPACDCGADEQTLRHIVNACPIRAYPGNLEDFLDLTPDALNWITNLDLHI